MNTGRVSAPTGEPREEGWTTCTGGPQLRVCHVISGFSPAIGGAEKATETLVQSLADQGTDVTVLTRRRPRTKGRTEVGGVPVYRAGVPWRGKLGALTFGLHGFWLLATRLRSYPILHVQNIDAPLLLGMLARILLGRRLVATIHAVECISDKKESSLGRLRLRAFCRWVDRFTAISPALVDELRSVGIEPQRIDPIPNPVDTTSITPATRAERLKNRHALGLDANGGVVFLFVGRLVALKQVDYLLEAMRVIANDSDCRLLIVGDGPEATRLREQADALGLSAKVIFTGALQDVRPALNAADVFVLPSRQEGLSVALLEAQAAGLACAVSDLPGNRELVLDGESGLVFPVGDVPAMARAMSELERDPSLRTRLGSKARRELESNYAVDAVVRRYINFYRTLGELQCVRGDAV